mmetsp:Transcript_25438/g.77213  ORF Transcript_25438/g.77213 Transcript_25438/m.77213 type:complete len:208 (-) Transcript_25438:786-1409(-)|eukprot:scaffold170600_cov31-Tisochrysis_lutea.AAC.2
MDSSASLPDAVLRAWSHPHWAVVRSVQPNCPPGCPSEDCQPRPSRSPSKIYLSQHAERAAEGQQEIRQPASLRRRNCWWSSSLVAASEAVAGQQLAAPRHPEPTRRCGCARARQHRDSTKPAPPRACISGRWSRAVSKRCGHLQGRIAPAPPQGNSLICTSLQAHRRCNRPKYSRQPSRENEKQATEAAAESQIPPLRRGVCWQCLG